jgi:quinol monooxygenase YgiN
VTYYTDGMSEPCHVIVTLTPRPGLVDDVVRVLSQELAEIRRIKGCEVYELFRGVNQSVVLVERWSSSDSWKNHFESEAIIRLKKELTPLLASPADRLEMYAVE